MVDAKKEMTASVRIRIPYQNDTQYSAVHSVIRHSFTTVPGILWIVTAGVLLFYRLNKKTYHKIVAEIQERRSAGESGV